jgi:hypothetical protein
MLRAEQFRRDTAKFWSDLDQKSKSKVLATEPQVKPTSSRRARAASRPTHPKPKKRSRH